MGLNCVLHVSHGADVLRLMVMIHALATWRSISRGNCLKNNPDFCKLQADPRRCMPQALDKAK